MENENKNIYYILLFITYSYTINYINICIYYTNMYIIIYLIFFYKYDIIYLVIKVGELMKEYRCICGKLLFKGKFKGIIEIKCQKCKLLNNFRVSKEEKTNERNMETNKEF